MPTAPSISIPVPSPHPNSSPPKLDLDGLCTTNPLAHARTSASLTLDTRVDEDQSGSMQIHRSRPTQDRRDGERERLGSGTCAQPSRWRYAALPTSVMYGRRQGWYQCGR
ncbi:hypothetical protein SVAN01_09973 [Stagonosporopsis vannaccii]|nr:hypothetical protein SVAN01_09973 [Stagonosporopsis vannaccii]